MTGLGSGSGADEVGSSGLESDVERVIGSREEADRVFAALADGGTVTMPLADQFWGDCYGALTDRFGVQWMVNHHPA